MGEFQKHYVASYLVGGEKNKNSFFLYDISDKTVMTDPKAITQLYKPELVDKDTLTLVLNTGIFGIGYFVRPSLSNK